MASTMTNAKPRRTWARPTLELMGTVGEVLQGGGGKNSTFSYDPGESKCPPSPDKCPG